MADQSTSKIVVALAWLCILASVTALGSTFFYEWMHVIYALLLGMLAVVVSILAVFSCWVDSAQPPLLRCAWASLVSAVLLTAVSFLGATLLFGPLS